MTPPKIFPQNGHRNSIYKSIRTLGLFAIILVVQAAVFPVLAQNNLQTPPAILAAAPHSIRALAEGPPVIENILGAASFVPQELSKLAHADVWYADYDWFREHGIDVPPEGFQSADFKKQMLDAFAWQTPGADDDPAAFTGETKIAYADYYGGYGMGVNLGSGRAAANGVLQTKGVRTRLAKSSDPFHSNGAVQSIEGVDEAIWSKILNSEMKFGSNRIVAVILTGTYGKMKSGQIFPRALIIREMALRPAHFMLNSSRETSADQQRVGLVLQNLLASLPYPSSGRPHSQSEALRTGVLQMLTNEATIQAEYYAKRMYFGSNSPSNLEITSRRLDLGDHSANEGYTKIYRIDDESPFGETEEFHRLFQDFARSLRKTLPTQLLASVPSDQEISEHFDRVFKQQQMIEMVRLTGAPNELIDQLKDEKSTHELGSVLVDSSKAGNDQRVFMEPAGYPNTSRYDVNRLLTELAQVSDGSNLNSIIEITSRYIHGDRKLQERLAHSYVAFNQKLMAQAQAAGLSTTSLAIYKKEASKIRNRSRKNLIRGDRRWKELWTETDKGIDAQNGAVVEKYIEDQSAAAIFNFKDTAPFQIVLKEEKRESGNVVLRRVFDAKSGKYAAILRINVASGAGYFKGNKMNSADLENRAIDFTDGQGLKQTAVAERVGNYVEFKFLNQVSIDLSRLELRTKSTEIRRSSQESDSLNQARRNRTSRMTCEGAFAAAAGR